MSGRRPEKLRNFELCNFYSSLKCYQCHKIKKYEIGRACRTHGGDKK